jgi:heat shock protein HtpX
MVGFVAFLAVLGWVIQQATGSAGLVIGFAVFGLAYAIVGYFISARVALALSGAKTISKADAPELYRIVENIAITAGLPTPKVYVMDDPAPNAFATGRDPQHASVAVTTGLLERMNEPELQGVIAHELSHVGNYDTRLMAIVMILVTIVTILSNFFLRFTFWGGGRRDDRDNGGNSVFLLIGLVLALVAPIVATIMQLAVSRRREYLADASGALLTRYPEGLASALAKIARYDQPMEHANTATAHLYFSNPLAGGRTTQFLSNLFSTHPPIEDRIKRLQAMENRP